MKQVNLLRAMAADCKEQGDADIAKALNEIANDVTDLCHAVKAERKYSDSGDSIAYLEARIRTSQVMLQFSEPPAKKAEGCGYPYCGGKAPECKTCGHKRREV
ncbi:MAG: hypothetical protein ACOH2M_31795 [Cypionkella sp.]